MHPADHRHHRSMKLSIRGCQNVDDAGVATASDYHQSLSGFNDQGLIGGYSVLDQALRSTHLAMATPISLRIHARNGTAQPHARRNLVHVCMHHKAAAAGLELRTQ